VKLSRSRTKFARSGGTFASELYAEFVEPLTASERVPPAPPLPPAPPMGGDRPPPDDPRRPSRPTRFSLIVWLKEARGEYKRVAWPTRDSVVRNSAIVLAGVVLVVAAIAGLDIALSKAATALFG
jgi:preprotein translocase subunit SecE